MRFLIIITGYNCSEYVEKCIASVRAQTYSNWMAIVINDGSVDDTPLEIDKSCCGDNRFIVYNEAENMGAAYRRYYAIYGEGFSEDVVVLLGIDDELLPNALERIKLEYDNGKWMTYGNWINQHGKGLPSDFELEFSDDVHANRSYRKVKYRSTAPNTFRIELFQRLHHDDFKVNGKWIDTTTESPIMLAALEMCGRERIGIIKEPIYIYNQNLPNGTQRRLGQKYKNDIYSVIASREKKQKLEEI